MNIQVNTHSHFRLKIVYKMDACYHEATLQIHQDCPLCCLLITENVELNSNKQRQFTCPGDQVIFTCRVFGSFSLEWRSPLITQTTSYTASSPPDDLDRSPFTASLVERSGTGLNLNFTSTLQVTASRTFVREATTVICLSTTANKTDNFIVAGMHYKLMT